MKRLVLALVLLVSALAEVRSEAATCSTTWNSCIGACRYGYVLCRGGDTGSTLCDSSESVCEEMCTSQFLDCANGGKPAI